MAATTLVNADVDVGEEMFHPLWTDSVLKPLAIFWLYDEDAREWRYVVVTDDYKRRGPQAAYLRVRNVLKHAGLIDKVPLHRIVVMSPNSPALLEIARVLRTGDEPEPPHGIAFYDCQFNDVGVPGMYVYHFQL